MIDQLPTAVPQAAQSANTVGRDRKQASAERDDQAKSFEDVVSKTGQQQTRQGKNKGAEVDLQPQVEVEPERPADARPKVAFELSAALRGLGTSAQPQAQAQPQTQLQTQSQAQMAQAKVALKDALKAADRVDQTGQKADAALAKLVEKLKQTAEQTEQVAQRIQQAADRTEAQEPMTPSDELGLLLGLTTTKDVDAKHDKKPAGAKKVDEKDDVEPESRVEAHQARASVTHLDQVAVAVDGKRANDSPVSDDKSSQNDVVRLVSANGRGRPLDIDVSAVPGETQRDTAKPATTAKIDTATVLEARRYLGFTPEPNATALATAIKADPTWTEALQAAQSSDLSTLGNTATVVNTLKLQMNPENLGSMVASLKLKGEELTVELRVNSVEAYQQLSADHDEIVKGLQDQGFSIDKVTVQLNATDRTDTGADREAARQGQAQREEQAQRDQQAQQRDGQSGQSKRNDSQREQQRWTSHGALSDGDTGDGRTDAGRSGNIYL